MAKYGSDDIIVTVGGNNMSNYLDTLNGLDIEGLNQETHGFGDSWVEHLFTGVKQLQPITLGGFYDDTATTGPDAIFNTVGTLVAVVVTWGGSKTSTFTALVARYARTPTRNELTRFEVELLPASSIVEA